MKLIKNFDLDPFLRVVWVNKTARDKWENVIKNLSKDIQGLEIESVIAGDRPGAWRSINLDSLPAFTEELLSKNLIVTPVRYTGTWKGFSHKNIPVKKGEPKNVYCIITREISTAGAFKNAFEKGDHVTQGKILGFPSCCIKAFDKNWKAGYIDPVWQMVEPDQPGNVREITAGNFHPYSNPLLRYIGLRVGFHIPCSFKCEKTVELSTKRLRLLDKDKVKILTAILSMPVEWNCYRGIAIIKTPIFYIIIQSNPSIEKYIVRVHGSFIPKEAVKGKTFPFNMVGSENGK